MFSLSKCGYVGLSWVPIRRTIKLEEPNQFFLLITPPPPSPTVSPPQCSPLSRREVCRQRGFTAPFEVLAGHGRRSPQIEPSQYVYHFNPSLVPNHWLPCGWSILPKSPPPSFDFSRGVRKLLSQPPSGHPFPSNFLLKKTMGRSTGCARDLAITPLILVGGGRRVGGVVLGNTLHKVFIWTHMVRFFCPPQLPPPPAGARGGVFRPSLPPPPCPPAGPLGCGAPGGPAPGPAAHHRGPRRPPVPPVPAPSPTKRRIPVSKEKTEY